MIERVSRRLVKDLGPAGRTWLGFRPSMPDSLPVIGRSPSDPQVIHAFGHGHVGLTLGGITGRLVAELASGLPPSTDLTPFAAHRF
jgi:D-amino-acid dehydrogenase